MDFTFAKYLTEVYQSELENCVNKVRYSLRIEGSLSQWISSMYREIS